MFVIVKMNEDIICKKVEELSLSIGIFLSSFKWLIPSTATFGGNCH